LRKRLQRERTGGKRRLVRLERRVELGRCRGFVERIIGFELGRLLEQLLGFGQRVEFGQPPELLRGFRELEQRVEFERRGKFFEQLVRFEQRVEFGQPPELLGRFL
jgi:hypothetical protein